MVSAAQEETAATGRSRRLRGPREERRFTLGKSAALELAKQSGEGSKTPKLHQKHSTPWTCLEVVNIHSSPTTRVSTTRNTGTGGTEIVLALMECSLAGLTNKKSNQAKSVWIMV